MLEVPLSSRPLIVCLLPALTLAGLLAGCDRKSPAPEQGNVAVAATPEPEAGKVDRSHAGEAAPKAAFQTVTGQAKTLADFAGKPLVVNLWATWCAPCVKELPTLAAAAKAHAGHATVLLVSQDTDPAKVQPFLAGKGLALQSLADPKLALSTAYAANLPTTIGYGADGKERWRYTGGMDWTSPAAAKLIAELG
jgi:thiol-disulfide isomerase/thioredoxin